MPEQQDEQRNDYAESPRAAVPPQPVSGVKKPNPLRLSLLVGLVFGAIGLFMIGAVGVTDRSYKAAQRMQSANNLSEIALAIHNYEDTFGELPSNSGDKDGKPLLSWRVHILPFIEHDFLYKRFKLDEPWDGPNNIGLLNLMPRVYLGVTGKAAAPQTYYRGFSSPGAVFERRLVQGQGRTEKNRLRIQDLADGPENTILVVEAGDPIEWTKPDDLDASPGKAFPRMGGLGWRKVFQALMADGSVRQLRLDLPETTLRALVTYSGGETLPPGWDDR